MSITIELPRKTETKLRKKAKSSGQDVNDFVKTIVEREMLPSWEELVKPIHEETKRLGLSEAEIEELIDSELAEVRKITPLWSR
ncbi:MAG: hypothetical protein ACRD6X_14485 [Pyrinomonadaceae bacterium]